MSDHDSQKSSRPWDIDLRAALKALYASSAPPRAWTDSSDHGYIAQRLIERSLTVRISLTLRESSRATTMAPAERSTSPALRIASRSTPEYSIA